MCLLLTSSMSFVDLPFQEHWMTENNHMDQNPCISSLCPNYGIVTENMTRGNDVAQSELNRAKVWPACHITLTGRPWVGASPKTILSTCPAEVVLMVSNAQRLCKEETWPPDQVAWPVGQPDKWTSREQSSARAPPYSSFKYHNAPPGRKCEESEV
jgi:hypothetical protein